jgi:hypothetical protein
MTPSVARSRLTFRQGRIATRSLLAGEKLHAAGLASAAVLELAGRDLCSAPLEQRKRHLAKLLRKASWAVHFNDHIAEPGDIVFRHACKLGFEGIVSKRLGSPYRSGRSRDWIKSKNPAAPAVKREIEEDWAKGRRR